MTTKFTHEEDVLRVRAAVAERSRNISLDRAALFAAIARLRRAMPRNADVLAVCAAAERNVTPECNVTEPLVRNVTQASNVTSDPAGNVTCPACAARRLKDAARVKRHRTRRI